MILPFLFDFPLPFPIFSFFPYLFFFFGSFPGGSGYSTPLLWLYPFLLTKLQNQAPAHTLVGTLVKPLPVRDNSRKPPRFCAWVLSPIIVWIDTSKSKIHSLNVNEWKFHSPIEWNSCKPLKKEWFCTLNSKFPLIKSENHSKKSELPLIWGVKRRTTRKRIVLRLTPQTSGNSLFLESFSLYMSGNLLFNVQNHSFLSGLQEFHSFGEWNFHSFTFREHTSC